MVRVSKQLDRTTLEMALVGYQIQRGKVEEKIRELQALLSGKSASTPVTDSGKPRVKRILSEAARARIAAAQRKRWAEHRKKAAASAKAGD